MFIDLTVEVTPAQRQDAAGNEKMVAFGHLGTHFDVMNKVFPLDFLRRPGVVFDVRGIRERDIETEDVEIGRVGPGTFAAFYTGFIEEHPYGSPEYFAAHPQLSDRLIDELIGRGVSIIGVDCAGIRRGREHTSKDQYCADAGVFVVENLCNLEALTGERECTIYTFPVRFAGISGLPCRVVAERS